jgi:hypothetical protein
MSNRPLFVVIYDVGSVGPTEIVDSIEPLGDVVLALCDSSHTRAVRPLAAEMATVVEISGDGGSAVHALRAMAPDAILTFSERRLAVTADLACRLALNFHAPETVRLLTDKYAQRKQLWERHVDTVRSALLSSPSDWPSAVAEVGLPAVVKPACGEGSRSTHLVTADQEGAALVNTLLSGPGEGVGGESALVLEEYLLGRDCLPFGDYVSVESAVTDGSVTHWGITGKFPLLPPFREAGHFWPAAVDEETRTAAFDLTTRALQALRVRTGVTHTELKLTAQGPRLIEVNGRLGGFQATLGRYAGGLDPIALAARVALGQDMSGSWIPDQRVVYGRSVPTPPEGGRVITVNGIQQALAIPGVDLVSLRTPGEDIPPGVRTGELAVLWGVTDDHATMLSASEQALDVLSYVMAEPGGHRTLTARELTGAARHGPPRPTRSLPPMTVRLPRREARQHGYR